MLKVDIVTKGRIVRTFSDAAMSYLDDAERSPGTVAFVRKLECLLGDRSLDNLSQSDIEGPDGAYAKLLRPGAAPATQIRNVLGPMRAVMGHAAQLGWCRPVTLDVPKVPSAEIHVLDPKQATALVSHAAAHLKPLLAFLISTGASMREAFDLTYGDVFLDRGVVRLGGLHKRDGDPRTVKLSTAARMALEVAMRSGGIAGEAVFHPERTDGTVAPRHRASDRGGGQIKVGFSYACKGAGFSGKWMDYSTSGRKSDRRYWASDLTPRDLRSTWAAWHWCIHRSPEKLRIDGGWAKLDSTEPFVDAFPTWKTDEARAWLDGGCNLAEALATADDRQESDAPRLG